MKKFIKIDDNFINIDHISSVEDDEMNGTTEIGLLSGKVIIVEYGIAINIMKAIGKLLKNDKEVIVEVEV